MAVLKAGADISAAVNHAITKVRTLTPTEMLKILKKNLFTDFFEDNKNRASLCYNKHDFWIHPCNKAVVDQLTEVYHFKTSRDLTAWKDDQTYLTITFKNGSLWGDPVIKTIPGGATAFIDSIAPFIRIASNYLLPGSGAAAKLFSVEMGKLIDKTAGNWEGVCKKIQTEIVRQMVCNYLYMDRLAFDPVFYTWTWNGIQKPLGVSLPTPIHTHPKDDPVTWEWVRDGINSGRRGNSIFDPAYYLQHNKKVGQEFGFANYKMAIEHWLAVGVKEGYRSSFEFDAKWYLEKHTDVANVYGRNNYLGAIEHWLTFGMAEGRQSSADFDLSYYLKSNPDVNQAFRGYKPMAFYHWIYYGKKEGRLAVTPKWTGIHNFADMQTMHGDIQLVGNTTIHVASGNAFIHGVISGNYSLTKTGNGSLILTGQNTYTFTVIQEGILQIGDGGSVGGPIKNNAALHFNLNRDYTYNDVISGTGYVAKFAARKLTLNAANRYTGTTNIQGGTLALGVNGSIEHSHTVVFFEGSFKFDVSAGNKKIKRIDSLHVGSEVVLGSKTLTIGTRGQDDGGGNFAGVMTGTGGLTKVGKGKLYLRNKNTYTGVTTIAEGSLSLGDGISEGSVAGNIVHNGQNLCFRHTNGYTYSGVISGTGTVIGEGAEGTTLTLNGVNTYTGETLITNTLVLGVNGSIEHSSSVKLMTDNAKFNIKAGNKKIKSLVSHYANSEVLLGSKTLTIGTPGQDDGDGIFAGIISGTGGVTKVGKWDLYLLNKNTYTGVTTIAEGSLRLGWRAMEGSVAGNIVHNGYLLHFCHLNDHTYSGVISGTGSVISDGAEGTTLTLNGANTYTGGTLINNTLALGVNGSIEHSSTVGLMTDNAKFNIQSGHKKVKGLSADSPTSEVILGSSTLTIGTPGQNDGTGYFSGKFTGTEKLPRNINSVVKTGKGFFSLESQYGTSGAFVHEEGAVSFAGSWGGDYIKAAGTCLVVRGTITFQGDLTLSGGEIMMDFSKQLLPKISARTVPATGVNTLQILSLFAPKTVLIHTVQPNGVSLDSYQLDVPIGLEYKVFLSLESNDRQLVLFIEKI